MSITAKSIVFDFADTHGSTLDVMSVRSFKFYLDGSLLPMLSGVDFTAYWSSSAGVDYDGDNAFDTSLADTGTWVDTCWATDSTYITNQRLIIVFTTPQEIDQIIFSNGFNNLSYQDTGVKTTIITTSTDEITSTVYGEAVSNSREIFSGDLPIHPVTNTVQVYDIPITLGIYATLVSTSGFFTLSNNDTTVTKISTFGGWDLVTSDTGITEPTYFEYEIVAIPTPSSDYTNVGVVTANTSEVDSYAGRDADTYGIVTLSGLLYNNSAYISGTACAVGDIIGIAVDPENGNIWFSKNNVWMRSGNPSTNLNPAYSNVPASVRAGVAMYNGGCIVNLRSKPAELSYAAPTGFARGILNPAFSIELVPEGNSLGFVLDSSVISSDQTDFPLLVQLGGTNQLHTPIFDNLGSDSKKIAITVDGVQCPVEIEDWSFATILDAVYPPAYTGSYTIATSYYNSSYYPYFATNPTLSVTGAGTNESWFSASGSNTNQKFSIDLGDSFVAGEFILQNGHSNGGYTQLGIKNFILYGTNSNTAFNNTTYENLSDLTELGVYQAREHISSDVSDPETFTIEGNTTAYRYYILRIADNWGHPTEIYMGFFHIEFYETTVSKATLHTKIPTYSATTNTELLLYWDSSQVDNDTYVGDTDSTVAQSVWDGDFSAVYHMAQDPSGGANSILDSVGTYPLTPSGSMTSGDLIDGDLGKAIDFDGADDYMYSTSLRLGVEFFFACKVTDWVTDRYIVHQGDYGASSNQGVSIRIDSTGVVKVQYFNGVWAAALSTITVPSGVNTIVISIIGTSCTFVINGVLEVIPMTVGLGTSTYSFNLGASNTNSTRSGFFTGGIEEIQVSDTAQSDDWMTLTSLSLANQLLFLPSPFDPALVPEGNTLAFTLDSSAISTDQIDFPLLVHLDSTNPLHAPIFADLGLNNKKLAIEANILVKGVIAKSVIFDFADHYGGTYFGVRSIDFLLGGVKVDMLTGFTARATSKQPSSFEPEYAFDTSLAKTSTYLNRQWLAESSTTSNQRLSIVFDTPLEFDGIVINNAHNSGGNTDQGVQNTVITSSTDEITSTVYAETVTNGTELFNGVIAEHIATDTADEQTYYDSTPSIVMTQLPVEIESWGEANSGVYVPEYPDTYDTSTVKSTSFYDTRYYPWFGVNPSLSVVGARDNASWYAALGSTTNQKVNIDLGGSKVIKRMMLENGHSSGADVDRGVKNFILYGTNEISAFENTTYATLTDLTALGTFQAAQHVSSDISDPQYFDLSSNTEAFRYYILRFADNWGGAGFTFRHVEFQSGVYIDKATLHTKIPTYSASTDTELLLSWDSTQFDNDEYIGLTGEGGFLAGPYNYVSDASSNTRSRRIVFDSTSLSGKSGEIRIRFLHGGVDYPIEDVYVWKQDSTGSAWDGEEGTGVPVTMGGLSSFTITADNNITDIVDFEIDGTEGVIIAFFQTGQVARNTTLPSGVTGYYKDTVNEGDLGNVSGYLTSASLFGIESIFIYSPVMEVWDDNFVLVYHMAQDPSGTAPQLLSSTGVLDVTASGAMTSADLIDGDTGKYIAFDGVDDYFDTNDTTVLSFVQNTMVFTLEAFLQLNDLDPRQQIMGNGPQSISRGFSFGWENYTGDYGDHSLRFEAMKGTSSIPVISAHSDDNATITDNDFHNAVVTGDGSSVEFFVDGVAKTTTIQNSFTSLSSGDSTYTHLLGAGNYTTKYQYIDGSIGEYRVSNIVRSEDWIKLTNLSLTDQLITWSVDNNVALAGFYQLYDFPPEIVTSSFIQYWAILEGVLGSYVERYGLKLALPHITLYGDIATPLNTFVEWYYDTHSPITRNVQKYGDMELVLRGVIEKYGDTGITVSSIIQKYGDVQGQLRSFVARYGDTGLISSSVIQKYNDALRVLTKSTAMYQDAGVVLNAYRALYNVNYTAFISFVERYAITANLAIADVIQEYSLTALNPATATAKQLYALLGESGYASSGLILAYSKNTVEYRIEDISDPSTYLALLEDETTVVSNVLVLVNNSKFVDFVDIEITSVKTSFFMECSIEVPDRDSWLEFEEGDTVKVINVLNEFTFIVRSKTRSFTSVSSSKYVITLESPTVKLIGPYAKTFSEDYPLGTARNVVEGIAASESVGVEWELFDWTIPNSTLYASDEFPIEVIKRVVHSAGGITQSTPEGNLSVIREYPVSPPYWEDAIPVAHISSEEDVFSVTETPVENDGYNHYYVTDQDTTSTAPSLVTEEVSNSVKTAKLFLIPFDEYADNIITLETTSEGIDIYPPIGSALIVFTETIVEELVEFKDGVGTLSNPCYGDLVVDWEDESLGDVSYTEDGSLTVEVLDGYSEGYTLAKITYSTKYYKWTVTNNASEDVQLFARIV